MVTGVAKAMPYFFEVYTVVNSIITYGNNLVYAVKMLVLI